MNRRHFLDHLAGIAAFGASAFTLGGAMQAAAADLKRRNKSAILLWMSGGPPTIDLWDMKPGAATGGPLTPISTTGDLQICERLPMIADQMKHLSVVRSMSTREADHTRASYYLRTGFVPNPSVRHPSYGAVVAEQMARLDEGFDLPAFVSVGGRSEGPGFLGMAYAPFQVNSNGRVRNVGQPMDAGRLGPRMDLLNTIESRFIRQGRGQAAAEHAKVLTRANRLMTSSQMASFNVSQESEAVRERYGQTGFGNGCLMARRLVEAGVSFVEVNMGGWDLHNDCFGALDNKLPEMDRAMSALVEDLSERGLLEDTVVLWMGEFGRTPSINSNGGRDHYARAWSAVVGGGGLSGGLAIGETSDDGSQVVSAPHSSEDLMATICRALGIDLSTEHTATNGRPMKIAGGGTPIAELFA
ncbi:DUF1501 domain-containing protein [Pseudobythopirellula maris]|nr:DUF1501 domain-containing protein [Pseudobythopirellula maris]